MFFLTPSTHVISFSFFLHTYPRTFSFGTFYRFVFPIFSQLGWALWVKPLYHICFSIFLLKLFLRHQIWLFTKVVFSERGSSGQSRWALVFHLRIFSSKVIVESAFSYDFVSIILIEWLIFVATPNMVQDWIFDIWIIQKQLLKPMFFVRSHEGPHFPSPLDRFRSHYSQFSLLLMKILSIFDVSNFRNDRLWIKTVLFIGFKFFLSKLLTFYVMGLFFFKQL